MIASITSASSIRALKPSDLASASELSVLAGWNQNVGDWEMLAGLPQAHCFCIEADRQIVSTSTLLCYGKSLAWIGMVLTRPEYRGHGFARRLFDHVLHHAEQLQIETLKLDATEQGKPLYESYGFHAEQPIERWSRAATTNSNSVPSSVFFTGDLRALDQEAFGADRSFLLDRLAARGAFCHTPNGFLFTRAGRNTSYLGPCIARDFETARELLTNTVHQSETSWSWDLLPGNNNAVRVAHALGFTRRRSLTRMARGKALRGRDDLVYAIAGFELG